MEWRERVAREKRAAYAGEEYWGRPVPGFGDPDARIFVLGLAPVVVKRLVFLTGGVSHAAFALVGPRSAPPCFLEPPTNVGAISLALSRHIAAPLQP